MAQIPFYQQPILIRRQNLKNHDFTIISSNCIGGVIYHDLNQRFDSPTINLWFKAPDFMKLLKDLHYYMEKVQLREDQEKNPEYDYPIGLLGDGEKQIKIYFMHYPDFKTAKAKWDERKQRIHYDNLYIIMTDRDGTTKAMLEDFDKLPYEHKVVLTGVPYPDIKSAFYIKDCHEDGHLGAWHERPNRMAGRYFEQFNYVDFFNGVSKNGEV